MRSREIETYKKTLRLSSIQREVLVGILLGDACLETQNGGLTYRLKVEQCAAHEVYVRTLYELFRAWVLTPPRLRTVRSGSSESLNWVFQTVSHPALRFYAHQFYDARVKRVPKLIHRWLTPRGLAYWYMDDGSLKSKASKGVVFNTQGFARRDVDRLVDVLRARFGLEASRRKQRDGDQIYVSGRSFESFVELIDPYVTEDMRHKLPLPRRTQLPKT
jgi:LAGLIDADG DNA endonuclease family